MTSEVPPIRQEHFDTIALELLADGFDRYSARAILHRIRWRSRGNGRHSSATITWQPPSPVSSSKNIRIMRTSLNYAA